MLPSGWLSGIWPNESEFRFCHFDFNRLFVARNTWAQWTRNKRSFVVGRKTPSLDLVFIVSSIKSRGDLMQQVDREAGDRQDILVSDNEDGYRNLPLKTLALMHYFHSHCHKAKYLLKVDDDVFVSVPKLVDTVENLSQTGNFSLGGRLCLNTVPDKNRATKYFISESDFIGDIYPPYLSGADLKLSLPGDY